MPVVTTPQIHAGYPRRTIGLLFRNEEWWRNQYHGIYNCGYALRHRYHPMWEPSWIETGKGFVSVTSIAGRRWESFILRYAVDLYVQDPIGIIFWMEGTDGGTD